MERERQRERGYLEMAEEKEEGGGEGVGERLGSGHVEQCGDGSGEDMGTI